MQTELLHARALQDQARRESEEFRISDVADLAREDGTKSLCGPNVESDVRQHCNILTIVACANAFVRRRIWR